MEAVEVDSNRLLWRDTIAAQAADSIALREALTSRIADALLPALGAGKGRAGQLLRSARAVPLGRCSRRARTAERR